MKTLHRLLSIVFFMLALMPLAQAQILDDSTKQIYSEKTIRYFSEKSWLYNDVKYKRPDTTMFHVHRFGFLNQTQNEYTDLGAIGSAARPVYFQRPDEIGVRHGYDVYNRYAISNEDVKYYDTKSPYTEMVYFRGFNKQEYLDAMFTRSISPDANVGFRLKRFASMRQIGLNPRNEVFTDNYTGLFFGNYSTKDGKYKALFNYRYLRHRVNDVGGTYIGTDSISIPMFLEDNSTLLQGTFFQEKRNDWHVYQQYSVFDSSDVLQAFYTYDRNKQTSYFIDDQLRTSRFEIGGNSNFSSYPNVILRDTTVTFDSSVFVSQQHKIGMKGRVWDMYYQAYWRLRTYQQLRSYSVLGEAISQGYNRETYFGFVAQKYLFDRKLDLEVYGEQGGEGRYLYGARGVIFGIEGKIESSSYSPTLMQRKYDGNHQEWENSFANTNTNIITAARTFKYKNQFIRPFLELGTINNLIYINDTVFTNNSEYLMPINPENVSQKPVQHTDVISYLSYGLEAKANWKSLHYYQFFKGYQVSGEDLIRAPGIFSMSEFYVESKMLGKVLNFQLGTDIFYRSEFTGLAYAPNITQYYLQNTRTLGSHVWADVFLNFTIKQAKFFIRGVNVTQGLGGKQGYEIAPLYPGQRRSVEFGLNWRFFT